MEIIKVKIMGMTAVSTISPLLPLSSTILKIFFG
jgi:hypothetical protein